MVDKPAGVVVHPARGHRDRDARRRRWPGRAAGGAEPERGRDRAPPRPRHVGAAGRRAQRCGPPRAAGADPLARALEREYLALVEGRPPARSRDDRRAAGPRPPRAHADVDRHRRAARGAHALRDRARAARRRRSCACAWRPAARTRSARTCLRSAIRSPATPSTARRPASASSASSCTPRASPSTIRSRGERVDVRSPLPADLRGGARRPASGRIAAMFVHCRRATVRRPRRRHPGPRPCPAHERRVRDARPTGSQHHNSNQGSITVARVGIKELLEAGVHFGHQTRRWNPKMRRFIFGERGGIYIIDLLKTERAARSRRRSSPTASPAAAAPSCSSAPRSRPATPSRRSPSRPACRTSTTAGWAAC